MKFEGPPTTPKQMFTFPYNNFSTVTYILRIFRGQTWNASLTLWWLFVWTNVRNVTFVWKKKFLKIFCSDEITNRPLTSVLHRVPTDQGTFWRLFSSQGNQGKTGGFQLKSGGKFWNQGTFFKTIFNLLMWGKKLFLSGEVLLLGSVCVVNWCFCKHYPNGKWRPHSKKNKYGFLTKMSW